MSRYYPPEWATYQAILFTWPHHDSGWQHELALIEHILLEAISVITEYQRVIITYHHPDSYQHILKLIHTNQQLSFNQLQLTNLLFVHAPSNDAWARDHGPITVIDQVTQQPILLDFQFNGWGKKYAYHLDNQINQHLQQSSWLQQTQLNCIDFVLEGGSIETDGKGLLLTTKQCLLNPNRNPGYSQQQIEQVLQENLGIEQVIWLNHGSLLGDDTDAHIDTLVRFAPNNTLLYVCCHDKLDPNYEALQLMEQELQQLFINQAAQNFRLLPLPLPTPIFNKNMQRLPATYANFLITNDVVFVPVYSNNKDSIAVNQVRQAFPNHRIYKLNCLPIIQQFGSFHCMTMQMGFNTASHNTP